MPHAIGRIEWEGGWPHYYAGRTVTWIGREAAIICVYNSVF